jgi:hypothetical protein
MHVGFVVDKVALALVFLLVLRVVRVVYFTHNEELHILYSSQDIIRHIKSRRMRWAGHVARME